MNEDESEGVNAMSTCDSEVNEHEKTSSKCDNEREEKTLSESENGNEEAVNVHNGFLNIYECGKNICQSTNKCACTASEQTFEYIWYRIAQCTSHQELSKFIHKHIQYFNDVIKYHLDLIIIYYDGMYITNEGVSACMEETESRNGYDENENCKKKTSDNNRSAEENSSKQTEMRDTGTVRLSYLNYPSLISAMIEKNHLSHC